MNWIIRKIGLRAVGAAMVGFAALFAGAMPSAASSYTLNFAGTVTGSTDVFVPMGIVAGDTIAGSITYDPFNGGTFSNTPQQNAFAQSASSFIFRVFHPGVQAFVSSGAGPGRVTSSIDPGVGTTLVYEAANVANGLQLSFTTDGPSGAPLTSLAGLPGDPAAVLAFLSGRPLQASGFYGLFGFGQIAFDISFSPVVATTPIPAALPLFGTGLALLGFAARKRRKGLRAAA